MTGRQIPQVIGIGTAGETATRTVPEMPTSLASVTTLSVRTEAELRKAQPWRCRRRPASRTTFESSIAAPINQIKIDQAAGPAGNPELPEVTASGPVAGRGVAGRGVAGRGVAMEALILGALS